jgi:hypothetical protein
LAGYVVKKTLENDKWPKKGQKQKAGRSAHFHRPHRAFRTKNGRKWHLIREETKRNEKWRF